MNKKLRGVQFPTGQGEIPRLEGYNAAQVAAICQLIPRDSAFCVTLGNPLLRRSDPVTYDHRGIVRALIELCTYAEQLGSEIWVNPCNDYTITAGLFRLTEAVSMKNFGYAWNILRTVEQGQTPRSAILSMGKRIRHVILEDGTASGDPDLIAYEPCPLGQGEAMLVDTVQALLEAGYTGSFSAADADLGELCAFLESIPTESLVLDPAKQLVYPMPDFLPPQGHPRVFMRHTHIPQIRENLTAAENADAYRLLLEQVHAASPVCTAAFNGTPLGLAESKAFYYALYGDTGRGNEAVAIMKEFCQAADPAHWNYNQNGETVYLLAVVYDWCYPLLDSSTRIFFRDAVVRHAGYMEIGYPPVRQGSATGHGPEGQLLRDLLAAGVAMFDEFPQIYQNAAGRFFREFIEPRKFVYQMHCFHQGSEYAAYRMQWELLCTWLFERLGLSQIFGEEQHETLRHYLYVHRPDGAMLMGGDCDNRKNLVGVLDAQMVRTLFLGANYWKDTHLKGIVLKMLKYQPVQLLKNNQSLTPVEFLLFNDPNLSGQGKESLPLVHFQPAPKGGMVIHTQWSEGMDAPDVVCELKINEYWFAGHQHLDAGAFQIYYKGLLASDDGYYQSWVERPFADRENSGYTGYGSLHHYNYLRRTIAHNCMLVHDPQEQFADDAFKVRANDGGQRLPNRGKEPINLEALQDPAKGYRIGELLGHAVGADYAYLKGDLAAAYSDKITNYERSFCFLRLRNKETPAVLLVYDRVVSAKESFRKTWLCHGLFQPQITGNRAVFRDERVIPGDGPYCGQYAGQLSVDTLLPERAVITSVGGPGKGAWVDGENYLAKVGPNQRQEGQGYRLEVSPEEERAQDYFLHALHIGDVGTTPVPARLLRTTTHIGAVVEDRVVLFGKERNPSAQPLRFALAGDGPWRVMVCDLAAGTWELAGESVVVSENGIAEFTVVPGEYELRRNV